MQELKRLIISCGSSRRLLLVIAGPAIIIRNSFILSSAPFLTGGSFPASILFLAGGAFVTGHRNTIFPGG